MALSNIFREPRREITESAIGLAIIGAYLYADYCFGVWFQTATGRDHALRVAGMAIGLLITCIAALMILVTHWLGEFVCDSLADRGLELRPRRRR
jgi:hypothetical protein